MRRLNVSNSGSTWVRAINGHLVNVLDNDKLHVDFKPLFECIHIYTSLDSLTELKRSYQADRKAST